MAVVVFLHSGRDGWRGGWCVGGWGDEAAPRRAGASPPRIKFLYAGEIPRFGE